MDILKAVKHCVFDKFNAASTSLTLDGKIILDTDHSPNKNERVWLDFQGFDLRRESLANLALHTIYLLGASGYPNL